MGSSRFKQSNKPRPLANVFYDTDHIAPDIMRGIKRQLKQNFPNLPFQKRHYIRMAEVVQDHINQRYQQEQDQQTDEERMTERIMNDIVERFQNNDLSELYWEDVVTHNPYPQLALHVRIKRIIKRMLNKVVYK